MRLCDAVIFKKKGAKVSVAKHTLTHDNGQCEDAESARGLVVVEIPAYKKPEEMERILREILEKDLGVPGALDEVSGESEKSYKVARYKWQHKIIGELTPEQAEQAEKLER